MSEGHRNTAWSRAARIARPRLQAVIDAGDGWCFDGRHPIEPGDNSWDVSHVISLATMLAAGASLDEAHHQANLTSSCKAHNRSVGGKAGAKVSNAKRSKKAFPDW